MYACDFCRPEFVIYAETNKTQSASYGLQFAHIFEIVQSVKQVSNRQVIKINAVFEENSENYRIAE